MNTVSITDIKPGMTVANIPSRESGMRTRIVGEVASVERYELHGQPFADVRLTSGTYLTNMSGVYELVAPAPAHRVVILPAGFTALRLSGDQLVTEVYSRYSDTLVSSTPAVDAGARGATPLWMREMAKQVQAKQQRRMVAGVSDEPFITSLSSDGRTVTSRGDYISSTR